MKPVVFSVALTLSAMCASVSANDAIERGRYLVAIGGCNDCHTDGYAQSDGKIPAEQRLLGSAVGFSGPWGVSYAANLRLAVQAQSETQWLERLTAGGLPPMPWPSMRAMTDADKRAVYRYIRSLGAAGQPAPSYVPPGQAVSSPHIVFVPQTPVGPEGASVGTTSGL